MPKSRPPYGRRNTFYFEVCMGRRLRQRDAESFFASLECEMIDRRSFKTKTEARLTVFTWIEGKYNPRRRHPALGYRSPINFE